MPDVVLRLLVLQFLVAAILWLGSAPLRRFHWELGPGWARMELTRWVLPLLMVVAGLLFFSDALVGAWSAALHMGGFGGVPAWVGRGAFLFLNVAVAGAVVAATGGTPSSPFLPLVPAIPLAAWAVGAPPWEVAAAAVLAGWVLYLARRRAEGGGATPRKALWTEPPGTSHLAGTESRTRWSRGLTLLSTLLFLAASLWMGGRLGG